MSVSGYVKGGVAFRGPESQYQPDRHQAESCMLKSESRQQDQAVTATSEARVTQFDYRTQILVDTTQDACELGNGYHQPDSEVEREVIPQQENGSLTPHYGTHK
jgi:hypothetical protein